MQADPGMGDGVFARSPGVWVSLLRLRKALYQAFRILRFPPPSRTAAVIPIQIVFMTVPPVRVTLPEREATVLTETIDISRYKRQLLFSTDHGVI
jgi:hypothetical protein